MSFMFSQPLRYKKSIFSGDKDNQLNQSLSRTSWDQEVQQLFLEAITFWLEDSVLKTEINCIEIPIRTFSGLLIETLNETRILLHAIEETMPDLIEIDESTVRLAEYHIFLNFDDDFTEVICMGYGQKSFLLELLDDSGKSGSIIISTEKINLDMDFLWAYLASQERRSSPAITNNIVTIWRHRIEMSGWKVERIIEDKKSIVTMGDSLVDRPGAMISELVREISIDGELIKVVWQSRSNIDCGNIGNEKSSINFKILLEAMDDSYFIPVGTTLSIFKSGEQLRLLEELNSDDSGIQLLESEVFSVSTLEGLHLVLKVIDREYLNIKLFHPFPEIGS